MLRSYDLVVYDTPQPWHRPGTNGKTFFKRKSDVDVQFQIRAAWMAKYGDLPMFTEPLRLAVTAFMPAPKRTKKWRLSQPLPVGTPDTDNLYKNVADALQGTAYKNDSQIVTSLCRKRYALTAEGEDTPPRWVITLEVIEDGQGDHEGHFAGVWGSEQADRHRLGGRQGTGLERRE